MAQVNFKFVSNTKGLQDGIKRSKKQLSGFESATKKISSGIGKALGGIGLGLGIGALVGELKEATRAAQDDILSQKQLARQLKITSNIQGKSGQVVEDYVSKLALATGVADDELRPALATALRVTGSYNKAQDLLNLSLDVAAGTGKDLNTVLKSVGRAYLGNVSGLQRLVPGIKKTDDAIGYLRKNFAGARATLADPFAKLTVAVDEVQEKIGRLLLPYVIKFAKYVTSDVIPAVERFIDEVSNPKTELGKTFRNIGEAVKDVFQDVKDFFALFGDGDAAKGFGNVATSLIKALPALLALKGILTLAAAGKSLTALVAAIAALRGVDGAGAVGGKGGKGTTPLLGVNPATLVAAGVLTLGGDTQKDKPLVPNIPKVANSVTFGQLPVVGKGGGLSLNDLNKIRTSSYTININGAKMTPNEIVAAIKQYERQTGKK